MPDSKKKAAGNVPGPYYVDDTCIDCDMCRSDAPQFFMRNDEAGHTYVNLQPVSPEEVIEAEKARLGCPSDSIGNDG